MFCLYQKISKTNLRQKMFAFKLKSSGKNVPNITSSPVGPLNCKVLEQKLNLKSLILS